MAHPAMLFLQGFPGLLRILSFHIHFRVGFSISVRIIIEALMEIVLNL